MDYGIYIDIKRCTGCQACVGACMDQNDLAVENQEPSWRHVFSVEEGIYPEARVMYVSLACMHCQDAPCSIACPTGAIGKKETGTVSVNPALCIGCRICLTACPFGVPRFNNEGKMQKCTLCSERVAEGLEPACVRICPTGALKFGSVNELGMQVGIKTAVKLVRSVLQTDSCGS
ncbi:MAG: 4Fe-4S dicluster domain-containing protein [Deltaproteobacteria bacterium]|nr:4Fe-4S dicluster domain-containing protein [Deltaproteobacteria bacterium]